MSVILRRRYAALMNSTALVQKPKWPIMPVGISMSADGWMWAYALYPALYARALLHRIPGWFPKPMVVLTEASAMPG